jgi:putative membrane protein
VTGQTQADISADMPFIREAASSNLMEIRLGQLAQTKATNQSVKQFGQRMVSDHTNMQNQLTSAISGGGQSFTPSLDSRHQRQISRLEGLSGAEFDRAYMTLMIRGHQEDVRNFQTQSQSARSSQVRTLASNSLPVLQQHVSLAVQVGNQVGADSTTTFAGGNRGDDDDDRGDRGNRGNVRADAEFIRDVGADNTMQIQLAQLARDKARNNEVRQFAERVITDHTRLQNQWTAMASRNGMTVRSGMGPRHREKVEQLRKANGNNVDRTYMTLMVQQHQDEVSYWQKEGRDSRSPQVRRLVNQGLPTMEQHLSEAKRIARQVGVDPEKALRNRKDIAKERGRDRNND